MRGVPRPARTGMISFSGAVSLVAIVAVLVAVSVPRLRCLAVQENEVDAAGTAQILARALSALEAKPCRQPCLRELLRRPELRGLGDAELLEGGRVMRRHGYLFEVTCLSPALTASYAAASLVSGDQAPALSPLAVRAWPWAYGTTGGASFLAMQEGGRLVHANSPVLWQGLGAAGAELPDLAGWRPGER